MFVNYNLRLNKGESTTASTINIPINMEYRMMDSTDLIKTKFVDVEVEKSINEIVDYETVRFLPSVGTNVVNTVVYNLVL